MQKEVQFKDIRFKIQKTENDYLTLADPNGYLKTGNILTVFKKIRYIWHVKKNLQKAEE